MKLLEIKEVFNGVMEMEKQKARIMWAVDGENRQLLKEGSSASMWEHFVFDPEIRRHMTLNPHAKFRLYGETGILIGELPKGDDKK